MFKSDECYVKDPSALRAIPETKRNDERLFIGGMLIVIPVNPVRFTAYGSGPTGTRCKPFSPNADTVPFFKERTPVGARILKGIKFVKSIARMKYGRNINNKMSAAIGFDTFLIMFTIPSQISNANHHATSPSPSALK